MISVTFQCDFGKDFGTGTDSNKLPQGWAYATLTVAGNSTQFLCCPLHQNLQLVLADPVATPTSSQGNPKVPGLQG